MPLRIAIIGGGIGGLSAACSLSSPSKGHTVTVYERSLTTTDVGFAFRITPNSDLCLRHLGIDTVAGGAVAVSAIRAFDEKGNVMFERAENVDKQDGKKPGGTSVFAFRPQLTQQLLDVAQRQGVTIKTGIKVTAVDTENTTLTIIDENDNNKGSESVISADLIIASDGLNSIIRPFIVDTSNPKYQPTATTHHNCLRFMVPAESVHNDPVLSEIINSKYNLASWKTDSDKRVLVYPVDYGRQYNLVCTHPEVLSESALRENIEGRRREVQSQSQSQSPSTEVTEDTTYDNHITLAQSLTIYADTDPTHIPLLFRHASPSGFRFWKLQDLDELPTWSRRHTVLLGDAAHAVLPFGFSGASMAVEDAVVLGEMLQGFDGEGKEGRGKGGLEGDGDNDELERILKRFEEIRKPRVGKVREMSRRFGRGEEDKALIGGYMEWLGRYDAVEVGRGATMEE